MAKPEELGQATLAGWRKTLADAVAPRMAGHAPVSEDQARAIVGVALFAASLYYVSSTVARMIKTARA